MEIGREEQQAKAAQRAAGKAARRALGEEYRAEACRTLCAQIVASDAFRRARTILLYRAVGSEADVQPLAEAAKAAGKTLAWPYCPQRGSGEMLALACVSQDDSAWARDAYGIPAPDPARAVWWPRSSSTSCSCRARPLTARGAAWAWARDFTTAICRAARARFGWASPLRRRWWRRPPRGRWTRAWTP